MKIHLPQGPGSHPLCPVSQGAETIAGWPGAQALKLACWVQFWLCLSSGYFILHHKLSTSSRLKTKAVFILLQNLHLGQSGHHLGWLRAGIRMV